MKDAQIREALGLLDVEDDAHWTSDGLPRVDVLSGLLDDPELRRADITKAAPHFYRKNPQLELPGDEAAAEQPPEASEPPQDQAEEQAEDRVEAAPVESFESGPNDELAETEREILAAQAELDAARQRMHDAQRKRAEIRASNHRSNNHRDNMEATRRYLRSQHATRVQRAEELSRLQQAGLSPAALQAVKEATAIDPNRKARKMRDRAEK